MIPITTNETVAQAKLRRIAERITSGTMNYIEQPQSPVERLKLIRAQGHQPFRGAPA